MYPRIVTTVRIGFFSGILLLGSCHDEGPVVYSEPEELRSSILPPSGIPTNNILEFSDTDWSGQISVAVYSNTSVTSTSPHIQINLPSDYVVVGGGAQTLETNPGGGAYLTESRPNWAANSWIARSKDHKVADPHKLKVYVIGLKIQGVSAATLRSVMTVVPATSSVASHPNTFAYVNSPYKLIGGGGVANWTSYGSLLVYSYPSGNGWYVKSKDHYYPEPTTVDAYAIGIQEFIPGFGYIDVTSTQSASTYVSIGLNSNSSMIGDEWVVTCPGAKDDYSPSAGGRMLTSITGGSNSVHNASTKDNTYPTSGFLYVYGVGVRKRH